jgi:hypothetical protein
MGADNPPAAHHGQVGERRTAVRYQLQLPVVVPSKGEQSEIRAVTRDVSARGIYFVASEWPVSAPDIEFKMIFPAQLTRTETLRAKCRGTVVRVEMSSNGSVGIAATIDTFTIA